MSATSSLPAVRQPAPLGAAAASAAWRRGLAREVARLADLPRCRSWVPDVTGAHVRLRTGPLLGTALATLVELGQPGWTGDPRPAAQRDAGPDREPLVPRRDDARGGRGPRPSAAWPPDAEPSGARRTAPLPADAPAHRAVARPATVSAGADGPAGLRAGPATVDNPLRDARPTAAGVPLLNRSRAAWLAALADRASHRLGGPTPVAPGPLTGRTRPPDPVLRVAGGLSAQWALPLRGPAAPTALLLDPDARASRPAAAESPARAADRAAPAAGGADRHAPPAGGVVPGMAARPVTEPAIGWPVTGTPDPPGAAYRKPPPGPAPVGWPWPPPALPLPLLRERVGFAVGDEPATAGHAGRPSDIDVADGEEDLFALSERIGRMLAQEARRHGIDV